MDNNLKVSVTSPAGHPPAPVSARCPHCGHKGAFQPTAAQDLFFGQGIVAGVRRCPNIACDGIIFIVRKITDAGAILMFPHEKVDFDRTGIPASIVALMEEAITCQATRCYTAAAIMVRKTLEVVCEDQGATGSTLHQRLTALAGRMVVSNDLMEAMKVLKLLGNDAAHVESKSFDSIGQAEVDVAIELVKEIVKAVYQHKTLVDKLNALKSS